MSAACYFYRGWRVPPSLSMDAHALHTKKLVGEHQLLCRAYDRPTFCMHAASQSDAPMHPWSMQLLPTFSACIL